MNTSAVVRPGGSLRRRLAVTVILTTALVVAVAGTVAWLASAKLRRQGAEAALRSYAAAAMPRLLARQWLAQRDGRTLPELLPQSLPNDTDLWRALVTRDGHVLAHSLPQEPDSAWIHDLPPADGKSRRIEHPTLGPVLELVETIDLRPLAMRRGDGDRLHRPETESGSTTIREGDQPGRRLMERLAARNEQRNNQRLESNNEALLPWIEQVDPRLVVLMPLSEIDAELRRQAWVLIGMWALACALVAAVVMFITGRVLAPVRRMTDAIAEVSPGARDQNVAVAGLPAELQPVQTHLNELLARVDAALAREQQTTANIAHELRTPLAGLRAKLELALQRERDPAEIAALCREGLGTMTLLQGLIDNLLLLTRLEAGQEKLNSQAVEVQELLASAWALHQPAAIIRKITLERRLEPALSLVTDADKLRAVFSNLLSNAVAYATPNSMIQVTGHEQGDGRIRLTVTNEGATISHADAERVFEPFWRGDAARTVERGHCGLGLPLVRRLVNVLRGTVSVSVKDGKFTVLVVLPSDVR
ncbi:MAG TPA: ATP-binding protein [Planctomycetota bacterium]|nr:ATP-binding protein [Planctomycetota bacterium]